MSEITPYAELRRLLDAKKLVVLAESDVYPGVRLVMAGGTATLRALLDALEAAKHVEDWLRDELCLPPASDLRRALAPFFPEEATP